MTCRNYEDGVKHIKTMGMEMQYNLLALQFHMQTNSVPNSCLVLAVWSEWNWLITFTSSLGIDKNEDDDIRWEKKMYT